MNEMKYEDLPENYLENLVVPPIYVQLPGIPGMRYMWKSIEQLQEYDISFKNHSIHETLLTKGWAPVSSDLFPKLPSLNGRVEWRNLVLCTTSLPDVDLFVENNEREVLDVLMRRMQFALSLNDLVKKGCIENQQSIVESLRSDYCFLNNVIEGIQRPMFNAVYRKFKENSFWTRFVRACRKFRRSLSG